MNKANVMESAGNGNTVICRQKSRYSRRARLYSWSVFCASADCSTPFKQASSCVGGDPVASVLDPCA